MVENNFSELFFSLHIYLSWHISVLNMLQDSPAATPWNGLLQIQNHNLQSPKNGTHKRIAYTDTHIQMDSKIQMIYLAVAFSGGEMEKLSMILIREVLHLQPISALQTCKWNNRLLKATYKTTGISYSRTKTS